MGEEFISTLEFQILLFEFMRKDLSALIKKMLNESIFF